MSNLGRTAVLMADYGWHVFPLTPGSKKPIRGTTGQHGATTDVETVLEWWTESPDANIGLSCRPSGLYVVDLDRHADAANGVETWRDLCAEHGSVPTRTIATPSGGYHLYYLLDYATHDLRNSASKLGPGVDTRGNGYVVAPPSVVDGVEYVTREPRQPIRPLPEWIIAALTRPVVVPPAALPRAATGGDSASVYDRLNSLARELATAADGTGNHTAARVAFLAGQYVGAGQVDAAAAVSVILSGVSGWSWRRQSDYQTMVGTITRQVQAGASSPRPWR